MAITLNQEARLEQTLSPRMIQYYELLACPLSALEAEAGQQIAENPALERVDRWPPLRLAVGGEGPADDQIARVAAPVSLREHLERDFLALAHQPDVRRCGLRLIAEINGDGYLEASIGEVAMLSGLSVVLVEEALTRVQTLDPPGVGARDLRECLALQLHSLAEQGRRHDVAARLVEECWEAFSRGRLDACARKLRLAPAAVQDGAEFLRRSCHPYPGRLVRTAHEASATAPPARPEVALVRVPSRRRPYVAQVIRSQRLQLRIDSLYQQLDEAMRRGVAFEPDDAAHVQNLVRQARLFIDNLELRSETIRRVAEEVANAQVAFMEHGPARLLPLTRLEVARTLSLHESTVGRAVTGKFVLLPHGEVVSLETFFDGASPLRLALEQLVDAEDKARPLSDEALAQHLAGLGFDVARRTVAKYRSLLKIPSAQRRRRA